MDKSLLVTVLLFIVILIGIILYFTLRKKVSNETTDNIINNGISSSTTTSDGKEINDPKVILDTQAHVQAKKDWCINSGYRYNIKLVDPIKKQFEYTCEYTPESCDKSGTTSWQDNACVYSNVEKYSKDLCNHIKFPYKYAPVTCDSDGFCSRTGPPRCETTSQYCFKMGQDYYTDNNGGYCSIDDIQNIAEAVLGKTVVREYKKRVKEMMKSCGDNFFSGNCAKSIFAVTDRAAIIIGDTAAEKLNEIAQDLNDKCSSNSLYNCNSYVSFEKDDYSDTTIDCFVKQNGTYIKPDKKPTSGCYKKTPSCSDGAIDCMGSILNSFPGTYAIEFGVKMLDGLLDFALGWTGMPSDVIKKGLGYVTKYGKIALSAIVHAGEDAINAIEQGGDYIISALEKLGAPFNVIGEDIRSAIGHFITIGNDAVTAIVHFGKDALIAIGKFFAEGAKILSTSISLFLHPDKFLDNMKNLSGELGDIVIQTFKDIGTLASDIYNGFKNMVLDVFPGLNNVFNEVEKVVSIIEKDVLVALEFWKW